MLVQREMETCRSPLASILPFSVGQFGGEHRCSVGEWAKAGCLKLQLVSKRNQATFARFTPITERRQTKLAREGINHGLTLTLPNQKDFPLDHFPKTASSGGTAGCIPKRWARCSSTFTITFAPAVTVEHGCTISQPCCNARFRSNVSGR